MGLFKSMKDLSSLTKEAKQLQRQQLRDSGALTDAEFEQQKAKILGG